MEQFATMALGVVNIVATIILGLFVCIVVGFGVAGIVNFFLGWEGFEGEVFS